MNEASSQTSGRLEAEPVAFLEIRFTPPPSVNNFYINAGRRRVLTQEAKDWKLLAAKEIMARRPGMAVKRIAGPVSVTLLVPRRLRENTWRVDIDNRIKPALDILVTMGCMEDDRNVEHVSALWNDDDLLVAIIKPWIEK